MPASKHHSRVTARPTDGASPEDLAVSVAEGAFSATGQTAHIVSGGGKALSLAVADQSEGGHAHPLMWLMFENLVRQAFSSGFSLNSLSAIYTQIYTTHLSK